MYHTNGYFGCHLTKVGIKSEVRYIPCITSALFSVPLQVRVDAEFLEVTFNADRLSLDYLIPTTSGPGVCTVALVYTLVGAHNAFIETYRREMSKRQLKESGLE